MTKFSQRFFPILMIFAIVLLLVPHLQAQAAGSISLDNLGTVYSENFDTLGYDPSSSLFSNVPNGWDFRETGTNANTTYAVGTGSGNTGNTYSFGLAASSERAFGGLQSGSLNPTIGASFTNNTNATITSLVVAYTGEQWRLGTAGRTDRLDFQYSLDATSLGTGTWVDVNELDFNGPVSALPLGALDGNQAANRSAVNFTIEGLGIPNGATFWLRWLSFDASGADDGLAVDDFSLTPLGVVVDAAPAVSSTSPANNAVGVQTNENLTVNFSENVNLADGWYSLICQASGAHSAVVSGGPAIYTLDPDLDFVNGENCTLTILAGSVSDADAIDPPDNMLADYVTTFNVTGPDIAPAVASTIPADGAANVPLNQNVVVNFNEAVIVSDPWFSLTCALSGAHPAVVSGGPVSFTLNPVNDFVYGETCTLLIDAARVSDVDNNDPPDNLVINFTAGFTTEIDPCTLPYTPAFSIQGSGPAAAITGAVATQGVVVGDYEYPGSGSTGGFLRGFYLQDLNGDGDSLTSDAIFVFNGNNNSVALGDIVRVTGTASDYQGQTQISASSVRKCGEGTVAPVDVTFPVADSDYLERFEGMLVRLPQTMYVTEHFQLGRFGQVVLSANGRLQQPTNVTTPGAAALALQAQNNLNKIILDDGLQSQNPDPILFGRGGAALSASNTLRGGDTATGIVGVLTYTWAGNAASGNAYRVRPVNALDGYVYFEAANPRPTTAPNVGGSVKVVGMNLLNYFNTFPDGNAATPGCFPTGTDADCRGASKSSEFDRQTAKTVAAILALNADVIGVNELENDGYGPDSALQYLVDQLNASAGAGTYAFINVDANTGKLNAMGTDAIRVAMIYKPSVVTPIGQTAVLDSEAFVNGGDPAPRNRVTMAQAFQVNANNAAFVVNINHLKSKGSACSLPDAGDGQGNCNQVRVNAVTELMSWLAGDPTGTGETDVLMLGDYNSYAQEDPITTIEAAGYTNLIESMLGFDAYSYVFDGQWGYLDQALASSSLLSQVTGVADYHINADEPSVLDYNEDFKSAGQIVSLYSPDQYRISDHDPVIVGLQPNDPPSVNANGPYTVAEGGSVTVSATGSDPNGDALTYAWDLDNDGVFETAGQSVSFSAALLDGPSSFTIQVQASDPYGASAAASASVEVTNVAPTVNAAFGSASTVCGMDNASLQVSFSDPAPADTHSAVVDWGDGASEVIDPAVSPLVLSHTYTHAGLYTANVTVTDDDGGSSAAQAVISVAYNTTGILSPLNSDGSSVFKFGSTIPVKIRFTDCDGSTPANLAPRIALVVVSGATPGQQINEPASTSAADTTGVMRFSANQYIYNLATKPLPDASGVYMVVITIPSNGQVIRLNFGLRP